MTSSKYFSNFAAALVAIAMATASTPALARKAAGANALSPANIQAALDSAYAQFKDLKEGANADYIPALAKVDPNIFGIVLVTVDGKVYTKGDVSSEVSIQSISKVFTMAKVIEEQGPAAIETNMGVDATGQVFNSINAVEQYKGAEMNAMVNPGAITATSMVSGSTRDEIWNKILSYYSDFAGRQLGVNQEVFKSESETNQRNQAIAMLMYAYGHIKSDPLRATDIYTEQCSVSVNAKDLATMAGTLANGGTNPVTGKVVLQSKYVPNVLAVMATAGLYDDSGKWLYTTGLPGKSGVGGGIIAVSPGKFGIAVISPPLDAAGNSVKAQKAIADGLERARRQSVRGDADESREVMAGRHGRSDGWQCQRQAGRLNGVSIMKHGLLTIGLAAALTVSGLAAADGLPRIRVLATGGTIAGAQASATDYGYKSGRLRREFADQRGAEPQQARGDHRRAGCQHRQPGHERRDLAQARKAHQRGACVPRRRRGADHAWHGHARGDGLLPHAGRQERQAGGDGRIDASRDGDQRGRPGNIYNGVAVAADPRAKGKGTLVLLNDEFHYARNVVKTDTTSVQTFHSLNRGPGGLVHTGTVEWFEPMNKKVGSATEFSVDGLDKLPRVDIIYAHANMSPDLIEAAVKNGAKGIVVAGVGDGNMTSQALEVLKKVAASGVVVVRSTRLPMGLTLRNNEVNDDEMGFRRLG